MTISMDGIHVFVFCCAEYEHLLDNCLDLIKKNVVDDILSINIVSNKTITRVGCTSIKDPEFWKLIDPDFIYRNLYNHNWIKQQILKLSVDQYVTGNVLIVDAEVLFTVPTQWIHTTGVDIYTFDYNMDWLDSNNRFMKELLDLDRQVPNTFITESMIFFTDILAEIKTAIEIKHKKPWLSTLNELLLIGNERNIDYTISEYELYGNYFYKHYKHLVNSIKNKTLDPLDNFITQAFAATSNNSKKTNWLTFYQQVRGNDWPDCDNEDDFDKLPEPIKQECIKKFGYKL
jgi:hypothetical protein